MKEFVPQTNLTRFTFYFTIQFIQYALMVANGRAYVQGLYFWTAITDFTIATIGFCVVRKMVKEDFHVASILGWSTGGTCGSLFAIYITKLIYGN